MREHKIFACKITSVDEARGHITGYLSIFGNEDSQNDIVWPGAFKKTIQDAYSRKEHQGKRYLLPLLWMHDANQPIGGYTELKEDKTGLYFEAEIDITTNENGYPLNSLAMTAFSGSLKGYIDGQSIGYEAIVKDYDAKTGTRNLREIRLWEGSLITMNFSSNDQALVTSVKSYESDEYDTKTVCGLINGSLGPRYEAWDGAAAQKWIWSKAMNADEKIMPSVARKYFMRIDGDPLEKSSYSYPFWIDDHINIGGMKAIANALQGARVASAGDDAPGMRKKIERLYARVNEKYPDDPALTPPWKSASRETEHKDFADYYAYHMCYDLLEDFSEVILSTFCCTILDIVNGEGSLDDAITQLHQVIVTWLADAQRYGLQEYLAERPYGSDMLRKYGSAKTVDSKQHKTYSPAHHSMETTIQTIHDITEKMITDMHMSVNTLRSSANDLALLWEDTAQGPAYAQDTSKALPISKEMRREPSKETLTRQQPKFPDFTDADIEAALASFRHL